MTTSDSIIDLPSGGSLRPSEADRITGRSITQYIVLAGAYGCGKTTLLSGLHERFLLGPFAGFSFGGSETLVGFEQICHLSRLASKRSTPDTERTKRGLGRQLLHLRLRRTESVAVPTDVLLTDISGEEFDAAVDSSEELEQLSFVQSAHHLVVLVDGERLANQALRQSARHQPTLLLRAFVESGIVRPNSLVDILFAKWDRIVRDGRPNPKAAAAFADAMERDLTLRFGAKVGRLRFGRVVSRDPEGELQPCDGLDQLIPSWVEDRPQVPAWTPIRPDLKNAPEFDKFANREAR